MTLIDPVAVARPGDGAGSGDSAGEGRADWSAGPRGGRAGELASLISAAGVNVTHEPAHPTDLVIVAIGPEGGVLGAASATPANVDTALTLGCGYPRRPMRMLADVGLGRAVDVLTAMHVAYGDPSFAPPPLLAECARARIGLDGQIP